MRACLALLASSIASASMLLGAASALGACSEVGQTVTCTYSGRAETVPVPAGVLGAQVHVRGGHGSQDNHHIGRAGAGGTVDAVLAVSPGELLTIWVADSGYGDRFGFARGGGHGVAPGAPESFGFSGGRGGGASALAKSGSAVPLLVGGGGGGGGGDGGFPHWPGGLGGAGAGGDGPGGSGGSDGTSPVPPPGSPINGLGGGAGGADGEKGSDAIWALDDVEGAGGGGGGGYPNGGGGGLVYIESNSNNWLRSYGGGGAGGGDSYAGPDAQNPAFRVSDVDCPEGGGGNVPDCQGLVSVTWQANPARVNVYGGESQAAVVGTQFADVMQAQVLAEDGEPAIGATVTFTLPTGGAGATFEGGTVLTSATAVTNELGVATAPPMVANGNEGPWSATATVGALPPAIFAEVNRPAATRTTVLAPWAAVAGQPISLTAIVASGRTDLGTPTGRVQFSVDGEPLGVPVALDGAGAASSTSTTLAAGAHELFAAYLPENPYEASSAVATEAVERASALVTVENAPNPSSPGEQVTITATVEVAPPSAGTPTGSVRFTADGAPLGPPVPLAGGEAAIDTNALTTGTHDVVARYDGDDDTRPASGNGVQAVGAAATSVAVSSSQRPADFGTPPTFTARLRSDAGPPTGAVDFSTAGGVALCSGVATVPVGSDSVAECTPAAQALPPGSLTIRADYESDSPDFDDSYGTLSQPVLPAPTSVAVEAQPSSAIFGQSLSLHADVTGQAGVSGSVRFSVDGSAVGEPIAVGPDGATLNWPPPGGTIGAGAHVIQARYSGDVDDAPSEGLAIARVAPALTSTTLAASANPAAAGSAVGWRAAVVIAGPGPAAAAGTVRFRVDGAPLGGPVALVDGVATSPTMAGLTTGVHDVQAIFTNAAGDLAPSRSTLLQQVVTSPAPPTPPPSPPTPVPPPAPPRVCRAPLLELTRLEPRRETVVVAGVALPHYAHRRATVIGDDQRVGRATVRADGSFVARVALPTGRLWHQVRYRVKVGRVSTTAAPLRQPVQQVARRNLGANRVRVTLALRAKTSGQLILERRAGCHPRRWTPIGRLRAGADGRIAATLDRPRPGARPTLYRVRDPRDAAVVSLPMLLAARR